MFARSCNWDIIHFVECFACHLLVFFEFFLLSSDNQPKCNAGSAVLL